MAHDGDRVKTFDVFVSYSSADKPMADAACAVLEQHRLRCWIAPRDITPGAEYGEAIIRGLDASRVLLLVFSAKANASPQVRREVERAVSKGLAILPFRIEDVRPAGAMEYAIGNTHWLDAFTPPVEQHLEKLARSVRAMAGATADAPSPPAPLPPVVRRHSPVVAIVAGVGLVLLAAVVFALLPRGGATPSPPTGPTATPSPPTTVEPRSPNEGKSSPTPPSRPAETRPTDKGTTTLTVGASVVVKLYTAGYLVRQQTESARVNLSAGTRGTVLEVRPADDKCRVRFGPPTNEDLWVDVDHLRVVPN